MANAAQSGLNPRLKLLKRQHQGFPAESRETHAAARVRDCNRPVNAAMRSSLTSLEFAIPVQVQHPLPLQRDAVRPPAVARWLRRDSK